MSDPITSALRELDRRKAEYGHPAADRKRRLLRVLERGRLGRGRDVRRLHEALCFLRAYPDDAALLAVVERMLRRFAGRGDLRRHRDDLVSTGIAGTPIYFSFFAPTALWLARHWPTHLRIDWDAFEQQEKLEHLLPLLALYCETPGLDEIDLEVREWIQRMKGPRETDAAFLLRRLAQVDMSPVAQEMLFEDLELPLQLAPARDTPARTREKFAGLPIAYQSGPLARSRPRMPQAVYEPPRATRLLSRPDAQRMIDLARCAMATRSRDLDAFAYADRNDVRLVDCGGGLQFAYIGMVPERRLLLETLYGFVMLKNGVPVGYGVNAALFQSAEVAYTVFDTFRSGEAALMFTRVLAIARHMFGANAFTIEPYQLGDDNEDALKSGAWWFYQKLGFEPRDAAARRIMRRELKRMKANRKHRSTIPTLKRLATANVFLYLQKRRDDVIGVLPLANVGLRITEYLAERFGFDRERARRTCSKEAAKLLGVRSLRGFSPGERLAWQRWAPLILILPGVQRWPRADKRELVNIVRAKGGRQESQYALRFDRHRRLRQAIRRLAESV
jgi:hypothetical protein